MRKAPLAALALAFHLPLAQAETIRLPEEAPRPEPRPYAPVGQGSATSIFDTVTREEGSLILLKQGLDALAKGDLSQAREVRDQLKAGSLDQRIMAWAIATSSAGVPSLEITQTASLLTDWPGMARLRASSERALYRENSTPREIVAAFGKVHPRTYEGTVALARAHMALGDERAARALLSPFWRSQKLEAAQETAMLREFGDVLSSADHRHRMEAMLYEERVRSAERVAPLADAEELAKAWAAVIRNDSEAIKLLEEVPSAQRSAGYDFAKTRHLRRTGKFREAAEVLLSAPRNPAAQIDTDEWWFERRALSRELLDIGKAEIAYRIVAEHSGQSPLSIADAEFHAGWYALRKLGDAATASRHFLRIARVADGPISTARAFYWLGRASEAGGPGDATTYYEQAATYGTAFYGQLAAAQLGRNTIPVSHPEPSAEDRRNFDARTAVQAILRLEEAEHARRAELLYRDLAGELLSAGELALLMAMAEERGNHYLALRVAKIAAGRGVDIGALTHPVGAIPEKASVSGPGKALAYAIARQESEFNVGAVSGAGARGLLQLMPGTAKAMALKSGLPYSAARLTSDAGYNATLGAAYLSDQLGRFGGSYILTFVGYNAGPRRAEEWIARYGDPRGRPIEEVVDWVERIPFTETRNYVQRVMENYQVYKMRLTGHFNIVDDLINGR